MTDRPRAKRRKPPLLEGFSLDCRRLDEAGSFVCRQLGGDGIRRKLRIVAIAAAKPRA